MHVLYTSGRFALAPPLFVSNNLPRTALDSSTCMKFMHSQLAYRDDDRMYTWKLVCVGIYTLPGQSTHGLFGRTLLFPREREGERL